MWGGCTAVRDGLNKLGDRPVSSQSGRELHGKTYIFNHMRYSFNLCGKYGQELSVRESMSLVYDTG